jgi:hypothetical protein
MLGVLSLPEEATLLSCYYPTYGENHFSFYFHCALPLPASLKLSAHPRIYLFVQFLLLR